MFQTCSDYSRLVARRIDYRLSPRLISQISSSYGIYLKMIWRFMGNSRGQWLLFPFLSVYIGSSLFCGGDLLYNRCKTTASF